jgi:hypothetical protein
MTTMLFAPAAYARYQTSGASYTADAKGVIAAAAAVDVIDLIRSGCTMLPAYDNFRRRLIQAGPTIIPRIIRPLALAQQHRRTRLDLPFGSDRCRDLGTRRRRSWGRCHAL